MARQHSRNQQQTIADMMAFDPTLNESPSMGSGMGMGHMGGPSSSQLGEMPTDMETSVVIGLEGPICDNGDCGNDENDGFTATQLKIAKRFVDLMGGAERAREAVDKVDEYTEALDLIDDEPSESGLGGDAISKMAGMLPERPDLPMGLANLYNPSAGSPSL